MARQNVRRLVDQSTSAPALTDRDVARARRRTERMVKRNPLRRVRLGCCGWVRDPVATLHSWVWCQSCADWARVTEVAE